MADYYSKILLSRLDDGVIHRGFCSVCRSGSVCLVEAIRLAGRGDLNDEDVPYFVRSRYADKHDIRFEVNSGIPTNGVSVEWRRMSTV